VLAVSYTSSEFRYTSWVGKQFRRKLREANDIEVTVFSKEMKGKMFYCARFVSVCYDTYYGSPV
jgi:hypothetical protein